MKAANSRFRAKNASRIHLDVRPKRTISPRAMRLARLVFTSMDDRMNASTFSQITLKPSTPRTFFSPHPLKNTSMAMSIRLVTWVGMGSVIHHTSAVANTAMTIWPPLVRPSGVGM
jgi:hypothetical protein